MSRLPLSVLACALVACAHVPPAELVDARAAYATADLGPASTLAPAELHRAAEALEAAEAAYADDWNDPLTRDLAYVALRTAQRADALGQVASSEAELARAKEARTAFQAERLAQTSSALEATRGQLAASSAAVATAESAAAAADARAATAIAELAGARTEARGVVITLSGSVLFRSGEWTLLPAAQARLGEVATALLEAPDRQLLVEGHTDAQGDAESNLVLSQRRSDAVRDFLVARGYPADHVTSRGIGEARPLGGASTPEGLANDRRVEIVVGGASAPKQ